MSTPQQQDNPIVYSIGINADGRTVVRIIHNGSKIDIETNVVSFAKLAARGIKVVNER